MAIDEARDTDLLRVLLVEDEVSLRGPLAINLEQEGGYTVIQAAHAAEVRRLLSRAERPFDVALVDDLLAPDADEEPEYLGITLLREIRDRWPGVEVIIFTGWGMERALEALRAGAYRYLEKPVNLDELGMTLRMAAEQARLRQERDLLSAALEISNAMVSVAGAASVLDVIAEAIPRLTGADACALALIDPLTRKVRYGPVIVLGDALVKWTRHLRRGLLTRQIVETGKPFSIADVDDRADELDENLCSSGVRSFIGVPIPAGARNLGVLYAYSLRPDAFGLPEERMLTLLARQAGIALENARLFDDKRRASEELSALNQVVLEIGKELDQPALLRKIIRRAVALLAAEGGGVYLLGPLGEHLTLAAAAGLPLDLEGQRIGKDEGLSGEILRTGEPQKVAEYYRSDKRLRILDAYELTGVAGAPIQVGDRTLGTLIVHDTRSGRRFDDAALALLQQVANHAGLALQKAELLEKQRAIQHVSTAIASSRDLSEVLNLTCQAAVELFGVDHSGLVLFDRDLEWGTVEGEYPGQPNTLGERIPIKGVPAEERLAFDRKTLVFPDVEEVASELGDVLNVWRRFGIRSVLVVPIIYQERVLGSFSLDAVGHIRQFMEEEVELCKVFAAHVAVAVENAQLFSNLSEANEWREALIENAFDAVIAIDQNRRITVFNQRAEEMFGWPAQEMIGRSVAQLHMDVGKAREILEVVTRGKTITDWNVDLKHRDGAYIPALLSATQIQGHDGNPIGQAGFIRNLRQVRVLEERLQSLIQASQAITGILALDEVLDLVVESTVAAFPTAQSATIHLHHEMTDMLRVRATTQGYSTEALEALSLGVGEGIIGWVFQNQQQLVVDDIRKDFRYKRIDHPEVQAHRSMICVPLCARGQVIGTLALMNRDTTSAFQPEDLGLLSSFADQAAIAIDNARRVERLEQLRQTAEKLARVTGVQEVLRKIVRSAREILEADSAIIWPYDDVRRTFLPDELVAEGIEPELMGKFPEDESHPGGTHEIVIEQDYLAVTNVQDPEYAFLGSTARGLQEEIGVQAFQGIALKVGDERLGVLYVNYSRARTFDEDAEAALSMFASHAALALKNAKLLEQVRNTRDAAKVVAEVSVLEDLEQTLGSIVKGTQDVLSCDAVSLYTYNQAADKLGYPPAMIGVWYPERATRLPGVLRDSIVFQMLERDSPYVVDDTCADPIFGNIRFVVDEKIKSWIAMPLKVGDCKVGVMFVNYRSRHRFTADELTNINLFGYQAAVAIRNAQLYEETARRANALQALYEASQAVTGTLTLDELLNHIVEQAWRLAGPRGEKTHFSHLALVDRDRIRFVAAHPPEMLTRLQDRVPEIDLGEDVPMGITGRIVVTGQSQLVGDVLEDADYIETDPHARSQLGVPIQMGEQVIGVINVEHPDYHAFDKDDQRDLESLAAQAAIAIQNARQLRLREGLLTVGEIVAAEGELYPALEIVAQSVRETIGCDVVALYTYSQEEHEISYPSVVVGELHKPQEQADWRLVSQRKLQVDLLDEPAVVPRLLEHGFSRFASCSTKDPILGAGRFVAREEIESSAGILLKVGEEVVGILFVNYRSTHHFNEEEKQAAELFAHQAAVAIRSARLYADLSRRASALGALYEAGKAVTNTLILNEILNRIVEQARSFTGHYGKQARFSDLQLVEGNRLKCQAAYPLEHLVKHQEIVGEIDLEHDERIGITGRAALTGQSQLVGDVTGNSDYIEYDPETCSELAVPIRLGEQVIGVINMEHPDYNAFDEDDQRGLESLAAQAATAIENARRFEDLKKIKGYIGSKTAVDWIRMVSTAWGHSVRREVGTALGRVALLRGLLTRRESPQEVEEELDRLENMIRDIREIPIIAPLSYEDAVDSVQINDFMKTYLQRQWTHVRYKPIMLCFDLQSDLDTTATVRASREWLRRALEMLVDNSVQAMLEAGSPEKRLTVTTCLVGEMIEISVRDTGPGIPEGVLERIFREPVDKPVGSRGAGIGLILAQTIVQTYGGDIRMEPPSGRGTNMVIALPVEN